jgi:hypothetical protein
MNISTREVTERMRSLYTRLVVAVAGWWWWSEEGADSLAVVNGQPAKNPCLSASGIQVIVGCLATWIGIRAWQWRLWIVIIRGTQGYGVRRTAFSSDLPARWALQRRKIAPDFKDPIVHIHMAYAPAWG